MALAAVLLIPTCHEAESSPEEWNATFEKIFHVTTAENYLTHCIAEDRMFPAMRKGKMEEYIDLVRSLRYWQLRVVDLAFKALLSDDLAARWLGASLNVRKQHVLVGIAGACGISSNLNKARLSCVKELRISYLSTEGSVLLDLIDALTPHDLTKLPANPQYISNDEWDKIQISHKESQDEAEKLALAYILVLRSLLITHVVQFIICSFLGRELPEVIVRKPGHSQEKADPTPNQIEKLFEQAMLAKLGKKKVEEINAANKAVAKERAANKVNVCCGCNRGATNRETFKRCAACWKIDREVLYCSEKCQRENWKQHKLMCGKPLDFNTAVKLATSPPTGNDAPDTPPPANGFKPPPELRLQMQGLKTHPKFDYVVLRSTYTNGEKHAYMMYTDPVGPIFRKLRDDAMTSGDRVSAALICDCILWDIEVRKAADFRREMVVNQISREYRFPLAELEKALEDMAKFRASIHNRFPAFARPLM